MFEVIKKMVKKFQINLSMSNKLFYTLIVVGLIGLLGVGVYAYGTSNPSVMGHSAGELEIVWDDISGIPTDIADGDDTGGGSLSCTTAENHVNVDKLFFDLTSSCPAGYFRTGCSLGSDATDSFPMGDAEPSGKGCKCFGYAGTKMNVYCYSYCCKIV